MATCWWCLAGVLAYIEPRLRGLHRQSGNLGRSLVWSFFSRTSPLTGPALPAPWCSSSEGHKQFANLLRLSSIRSCSRMTLPMHTPTCKPLYSHAILLLASLTCCPCWPQWGNLCASCHLSWRENAGLDGSEESRTHWEWLFAEPTRLGVSCLW